MTKNIWAGLVALVLVITCGVLEVVLLSREYEKLSAYCGEIMAKCDEETVTVEDYEKFRESWVRLRETSELLLPHLDVYEINLRFAEGQAYVEQRDYDNLMAQLTVIDELLKYVPHLMKPSFKHIL
ncbi:MAG: DUF4363 family protein [Corallococcus sp.]|nr:DUF4363 family protein [Bacillota bacterium]MCM1534215.1 DUF4363 family protein [Corallococcus sp.]